MNNKLDRQTQYELREDGFIIAEGEMPAEIDENDFVQIMWRTMDTSSNTLRAAVVDWSWDSMFPTTDIIACKLEKDIGK